MTPPLVKSFHFGFFIFTLYQENVTSAFYCYTVISTNDMVLVSKYEFEIWKRYTQNCHKINITDCFRCTYHTQVNLGKLMLFIHFYYFFFCLLVFIVFFYPLQSKNSIFYKAAVIIFNYVVAAVFCCCGCGCCGLCCCCCCCYCCCCYDCHCCY